MILAFGRGVFALGSKSLWWDESLSLHRARNTLPDVLTNKIVLTDNVDTVDTIDNHPPLYFVLLWASARLFGQSEFALRFLSLAAIVLMVPLLFLTGRRLVDEWAGFGAAALGAMSPMYLWYGQEARMYALLAFLALLSFYSFARAFIHHSRALNVKRDWPWLLTCVLVSLSVILTHYLGVLFIFFELIALVAVIIRQTEQRRAVVGTMIALVLLSVPLLVYAWLTLPRSVQQPGFYFVPLSDLLRDLLNSFSLGLSVDIDYWYVLAIDGIFLTFLLIGFAWLIRPKGSKGQRGAGWLLAGYLVVPITAIYLVSYVQPAYMNSRHMILISPAFYLLVSVGLTRWRGRAILLPLLGALLMVAGIGHSTWNYFVDPTYNKDNHREWGAYLREHVRPGDVVVVEPPHIAELYDYYASSEVSWIGLPLLNGSSEQTVAILEDLRDRYDRVWLAYSRTPPWGDKGRIPKRWLDENAFRADYKPIHSYASSVFVANYLPTWPSVGRLPLGAESVEVQYSHALRMMGYRQVSPAKPGKPLHVQLFWAVDEPITEEASILLRLVDEQGHLWGQSEQCPFNGLYPMWQWQPGLIIPDEHELFIQPGAPPGAYQMEIVLVSRPTEEGCLGSRGDTIPPMVAASGANRGDRVLLGTVDVQRPEVATTADLPDMGRRHLARFNGLELLGSSLVPAELEPGARLAVTLLWRARDSGLADMQFRLRIVDETGVIRQEQAIRPAGEQYPTNQWQSGDWFKGQFWLRVPQDAPGGRYDIDLVPESPLRQTGLGGAVGRLLGRGAGEITLGNVRVLGNSQEPEPIDITPIPTPANLAVSHPMLATLGNQIRFLGYDLDADATRVGETLSFTLYWQALAPMDVSYTVFTHLLGASNRVLGQKDSVPQDGSYPTTLWQPGEVIADTYSFAVAPDAPPGSYPIEIGMYRLETVTRLAVTGDDGQPLGDRILLDEIDVLPALPPPTVDRGSWHWFYLPLIRARE